MDNWTLPLSEEGTREVIEEQSTRPARNLDRLNMLYRVRDAVRALRRDEAGAASQHRPGQLLHR